MSDKRRILKASGILGILTLASRFTGLLRDSIAFSLLGSSRISDVFWFAFEIPNLARRVIGEGSLSAFIVPIFANRKRESEQAAWTFVNRSINIVSLATLAITLVGMLFSPFVFKLFGGYGMLAEAAPGDTEVHAAVAQGGYLTRIMFPHLMILAVGSIMMGVCNAIGSFTAPGIGSLILNIAMIVAGAGALYFRLDPVKSTVWLAWSVVIGAVLRVVVMIPPMMQAGWRWGPQFSGADQGVSELFRMMGTGLFGMSIYHINITIDGLLAGFAGEGTKTFLIGAQRLIQFPLGLTAAAIATAMMPRLTDLVLEKNDKELSNVMGFFRRVEIVLMTPAAIGLMFFGLPIIQLVFQHGRVTKEDCVGTAWALLFYAPSLIPQGGLRLILPLYYAEKDMITPVKAAIASVCTNTILGAIFVFFTDWRQMGLALAGTIAAFVNYQVLAFHLKRSGRGVLIGGNNFETLSKSVAAAILSIGGCWSLFLFLEKRLGEPTTTFGRMLHVLPFVAASAAIYFAICHLLKVPDSKRAVDLIRQKIFRKRKAS